MQDILKALAQLDVTDNAHWTSDGAPLVEVITALTGRTVTRSEIRAAAPEFVRTSPKLPAGTSVTTLAPVPLVEPVAASEPPAPVPPPATPTEQPAVSTPPPATGGAIAGPVPAMIPDAGNLVPDLVPEEPAKPRSVFLHTQHQTDEIVDSEAAKSLIAKQRAEDEREFAEGHRALLAIENQLAELSAERDEINVEITNLQIEQSKLQRFSKIPASYDAKADQEARMAWIDAQNKSVIARHERAQKVVATLARSQSPLDAAMVRKTDRGRPNFNPSPAKR